jgi:hypothetical protein
MLNERSTEASGVQLFLVAAIALGVGLYMINRAAPYRWLIRR